MNRPRHLIPTAKHPPTCRSKAACEIAGAFQAIVVAGIEREPKFAGAGRDGADVEGELRLRGNAGEDESKAGVKQVERLHGCGRKWYRLVREMEGETRRCGFATNLRAYMHVGELFSVHTLGLLMGTPEPQDVIVHLTELLQEKRRTAGIFHEILAQASGVHRSTVSRVEAGTINGTLFVFLSLAKAMNVSLGDLLQLAEKRASKLAARTKRGRNLKKG